MVLLTKGHEKDVRSSACEKAQDYANHYPNDQPRREALSPRRVPNKAKRVDTGVDEKQKKVSNPLL